MAFVCGAIAFLGIGAFIGTIAFIGTTTGAIWWGQSRPAPPSEAFPLPPFPPRIAQGGEYEACLATLVADPAGTVALAETWLADGGGDAAMHCRGLALVADGEPSAGADVLEQLAARTGLPAIARAFVLGQAAQARLMVGMAEIAARDVSLALGLSPADTGLLILRATAEGVLGQVDDAVDDLTEALRLDDRRPDALVARAVMRRKLNRPDLARDDVEQALRLDPEDADALLERGILRHGMGDAVGARADWEHARKVDPDSDTAALAEQNLSLLEVGAKQR